VTDILEYLGVIGTWAIRRLPLISLELGVFALIIMMLLKLRIFRPARIQKWFWLVVLAKPMVILVIISPLALNLAIFQDARTLPSVTLDATLSQSDIGISGELYLPDFRTSGSTSDTVSQHPSFWSLVRGSLDWSHGVAILWISGLTFLCARALMGFRRLSKLRRQAVPIDCLHDALASLGSSPGMRRLPEIRVSGDVSSPLLFGLFRPVILLPPGFHERLSPEALRLVLLHELFHWRHHDTWMLLLKRLVEALFFFHPAVWYAGKMVVCASEQACDDAVVSFAGNSTAYASCLLSISESAGGQRRYALAGLAIKDSAIGQRIKRILKEGIPMLSRKTVLASLCVLVLVSVLGLPTFLASTRGEEIAEPASYVGQIAFESTRDGNSEIYVMDADGKNQLNLTENPAFDCWPAWSPDGQRIAFHSGRAGNSQIYVMDADGKNPLRLTFSLEANWGAACSPDGQKITFVRIEQDGNSEIYGMDADGGNPQNLTNNPAHDAQPHWSPDGRISFYSDRDGSNQVYVMDADGNNLQNLTKDHPKGGGSPAWSPDGQSVAFVRWHGTAEIYVMDADGKNPHRLTDNTANDKRPVWSPDGKWIAFASERDGNAEIYVMDADGNNQRRLTNNTADDIVPAWFASDVLRPVSPAGKLRGTWGKIKALMRRR